MHAPQYAFRGIGMDLELIDWLNTHTFPEEQKYKELDYAKRAYRIFGEDFIQSATTRACIFGTIHTEATLWLMEFLEKAGMSAYVGKVNMDWNSLTIYVKLDGDRQQKTQRKKWILQCKTLKQVKPILTPRFIPSCSDELMEALSKLQKRFHLPVQSHLSENLGEIQWVRELCPDTCYGEAYDKYQMFGGECPTIMAHCVHSTEEEQKIMKEQGVFVAHCPPD